MDQLICPLDGDPCERDCPDRYVDQPEGGCILTMAQELGCTIIYLGGDAVGALYVPGGEEATAQRVSTSISTALGRPSRPYSMGARTA